MMVITSSAPPVDDRPMQWMEGDAATAADEDDDGDDKAERDNIPRTIAWARCNNAEPSTHPPRPVVKSVSYP